MLREMCLFRRHGTVVANCCCKLENANCLGQSGHAKLIQVIYVHATNLLREKRHSVESVNNNKETFYAPIYLA